MVRDHALHKRDIGVGIDIAHTGMHLVIGSGISLLCGIVAGGRICCCRWGFGGLFRRWLLARRENHYSGKREWNCFHHHLLE
jgi:hypothetical protein